MKLERLRPKEISNLSYQVGNAGFCEESLTREDAEAVLAELDSNKIICCSHKNSIHWFKSLIISDDLYSYNSIQLYNLEKGGNVIRRWTVWLRRRRKLRRDAGRARDGRGIHEGRFGKKRQYNLRDRLLTRNDGSHWRRDYFRVPKDHGKLCQFHDEQNHRKYKW